MLMVLAHLLAFVVYTLLTGFVLYKNPKSRLNRLCALANISFAIWALADSYFHNASSPESAMFWMNISSIGWCSFPFTTSLFYLAATGHEKFLRNRPAVIAFGLLAVFLITQQWTGHLISGVVKQPYGWSTDWATSVSSYIFYFYYSISVLGCIFLAYNTWHNAKGLREKKQARVLWVSAAVCFILCSTSDVILPALGIYFFPPIAIIFILIWAGGLAYAITRYGLMSLTPQEAADKILATMGDALMLIDPNGKIITANQAALDLLGYEKQELLGREFTTISSQSGSVDSQSLPLFLGEDALTNQEFSYKAKSGKTIPVLLSTSVLKDQEGELAGFITVAHDITEYLQLKQALWRVEQRYQGLVDHALVGIGIHQNAKFVLINKELAYMFGYATAEECIGLPIADRIHPDERDMVMLRAQRRQAGIPQPETYEIRLLKKDGSSFYALISNTIIEYEGQPATLITVSNLNDTKARKELEQANKELKSFTYSVSHDLRAPLRSIDGFSLALLEDYADQLDAQGKDYLQRVRAASQRMGELIDDLLALSRVSRTAMHYEEVDLSSMARAVIGELREAEPERQVEFIIADGLTALGDKSLLRIVMENLLRNAWKYTGKHARARIEFGLTWQEGMPVYFVRDDGAGFDMAYSDKLFNPFQRLHNADEFPGIGIGLSTVQRIIHRHGGEVWAEAAPEKGATFYFTIP